MVLMLMLVSKLLMLMFYQEASEDARAGRLVNCFSCCRPTNQTATAKASGTSRCLESILKIDLTKPPGITTLLRRDRERS